MREYTEKVEAGLDKAIKKVSLEGVKKLKAASPKRTGKYSQGWASKQSMDGRVIYNRTSGQLTHLLEKGHALRKGGRTRAFVHIKPVEKSTAEKLLDEVKKVIKNG